MKNKKFFKILTLLLVLLAGVTAVFTLTSADTPIKIAVSKIDEVGDPEEIILPIHITNREPQKDFAMLIINFEFNPETLEYIGTDMDRKLQRDGWQMLTKVYNKGDELKDESAEPGKGSIILALTEGESNYNDINLAELVFAARENVTGKQDIKITNIAMTRQEVNGHAEEIEVVGEDGYATIAAPVKLDTVQLAENSKSFKFDMSGTKTGKINVLYSPNPTTTPMDLKVTGCESIIDVDAEGNLNAKANGTATCTVTAFGKVLSDKINVEVVTSVTDVKINETDMTLSKNAERTLTATVSPATATVGKDIKWSSSDPSIVSVEEATGKIKALRGGEVTITATTANGKTATVKVIVDVQLTGFTLDVGEKIELTKDTSKTVNVTFDPSDAYVKDSDVKWTSSDAAVSVTKNTAKTATITGVSGKKDVTITVTIKGITKTFKVDVNVPISGIEVTPNTDQRLLPGQSVAYTGTILPVDNTEGKTITWSVDNSEVVELKDNKIVAKAPGTTKVTAKIEGTSFTKTINVKVLIPIEEVYMSESSVLLATTANKTLSVKVAPEGKPAEDMEDYTVTWSSSNPKVATVDENGKVTAVAAGTAEITATLSNKKIAKTTVTVFEKVESITVKDNKFELNRGEKATIEATVNPTTATEQNITWKVDNADVATLNVANNHKPVITAVNGGTTTITGTITDKDGAVKQVTVTVTVKVPITKVVVKNGEATVNDKTITLVKDGNVSPSVKLTAEVLPVDTTENKTIKWGVENPEDKEVITVDANGTVIGLKGGYAYVTATAGKVTTKVKVYVKVPIKEFKLVEDTFELRRTDSLQLQTVITPADTTENTKITWVSSNPKVATVDANGKVTGVSKGEATITGSLENGKKVTAKINVYIVEVEDIKFTESDSDDEEIKEITAYRTVTKDLAALLNIYPANATELSTIIWTSSDEKIVKVNEKGELEPVALGTATITAKMGDKEASIKVNVEEIKLESISVKQDISKIKIGESIDLEIVKNPYNATEDVTFKYETSDKTIVKVDENGKLSAVGVGTAEITITASNGVKVTYKVTVEGTESPNTSVKSLIPYGISSLAFLGGIAMTIKKLKENEITLM